MIRVSRLASLAGFLFCSFGALTAIRLGIAETLARQGSAESLRAAIAIQGSAPSAEFLQRLAEEDPLHAHQVLVHVVQTVNARSSAAWIELGMFADARGDGAAAERSFLEAARVDHQYLPAWTLANFYFRQGKREAFWLWMDRAAPLTYDEFPPMLQLCDQFEPEPGRMLSHFRNAGQLRTPYLKYLMGQNRLQAAQQVARQMADDRANDPHLIDLADRQIRAGHAEEAIEMWNVSSGLNLIDPGNGKILSNGNLARAPLNLGFDWRMSQTPGVTSVWKPSELIFQFSGSQSEYCSIVEQTIPLNPRQFRLRFDYMTGLAPMKGIHWALGDVLGPLLESSETWREGRFDLPRASGLANLKLLYKREPGTTRIEGRIEIRRLRLEPA